jgi:hypothetical protein
MRRKNVRWVCDGGKSDGEMSWLEETRAKGIAGPEGHSLGGPLAMDIKIHALGQLVPMHVW